MMFLIFSDQAALAQVCKQDLINWLRASCIIIALQIIN